MSPANYHGDEQSRREINGPRPTPLRISKDSHAIQKPSSSYPKPPPSMPPSGLLAAAAANQPNRTADHQNQPQQQQNPVIIYAHSPKIIHTKPRDFMALVQKLTGLSSSSAPPAPRPQPRKNGMLPKEDEIEIETKPVEIEDNNNESSSGLTDEKHGSPSSLSPTLFNLNAVPNHPYLADIPLFTPNSSNFFLSPRPLYRYVDTVFPSPNMGSVFEAIKELPQY